MRAPATDAAEWEDDRHRWWVHYCRLCFEREVPGEPDPVTALEVEVDSDGLPTVEGFLQLCAGALAKLEAEARLYLRLNRSGVAQTEEDLARAAVVAARKEVVG